MNLLCLIFTHKLTIVHHNSGVFWDRVTGAYDLVCERNCDFRYEQTKEGLEDLLESQLRDPRNPLYKAVRSLLSWTKGGACSDCDMFRAAPSDQVYLHHKDCGHLEDINAARKLIGFPDKDYHEFDDPIGEMNRLAEERMNRK